MALNNPPAPTLVSWAHTPHLGVTADYLIYQEEPDSSGLGGGVSVIDHKGKMIVKQEKDASLAIQKAVDLLPATGGKIYIATGRYVLSSTVMIEDKCGVHIEGTARGIIFSDNGKAGSKNVRGGEGTVLTSEKAIDLLCVFGNTCKASGITLSNLHFIGSGKDNGKAGLLVKGETDLLSLMHVGSNNSGIGFHFQGGDRKDNPAGGVPDAPYVHCCDPQANGIGLYIERCHYGKFIALDVSDCDTYGVYLSSKTGGDSRIQGLKFIGVTALRCNKAAMLIGQNCEDITVTGGCDFGGCDKDSAFGLTQTPTRKEDPVHAWDGSGLVITDEDSGHIPCNIIITNNHCYNNKNTGIWVDKARYVVVQGNICSDHDHSYVKQRGQQHGIYSSPQAQNVEISGNIQYGNAK